MGIYIKNPITLLLSGKPNKVYDEVKDFDFENSNKETVIVSFVQNKYFRTMEVCYKPKKIEKYKNHLYGEYPLDKVFNQLSADDKLKLYNRLKL